MMLRRQPLRPNSADKILSSSLRDVILGSGYAGLSDVRKAITLRRFGNQRRAESAACQAWRRSARRPARLRLQQIVANQCLWHTRPAAGWRIPAGLQAM